MQDHFGQSLFLKAKRQGRREDVKWHGVHLLWERETWTTINVLGIVSEGGNDDDMSTDRRYVNWLAENHNRAHLRLLNQFIEVEPHPFEVEGNCLLAVDLLMCHLITSVLGTITSIE